MIGKNIRSNEGSVAGSMLMNLIVIAIIMLGVPFAVVSTERVQSLSEDVSYFSPEKVEDFHNPDGSIIYFNGYSNIATGSERYVRYSYANTTGDNILIDNSGLYTKNQTGNDYHEYLASGSDFDKFYSLSFGLNQSTGDLIEDDLSEIRFTGEFSRNSTLKLQSWVGNRDDSDDQFRYKLAEKSINTTTDLQEYSLEIDYSKILDADSQSPEDGNQLSVVLQTDGSYDEIQPADSLRFNIDLIHSTSRANRFFTTQIVSGILAIPVIVAGIFATPYFDFRETFGGR